MHSIISKSSFFLWKLKGCLVGRNLLYPEYDDPRAVGLAVSKIIQENLNTEEAVKLLASSRGDEMDFLTSKIMGMALTSAEIGYL